MEVARCKAVQIQRTEVVRESYVTSKQTQPNAYTSVMGVRANVRPKRSGSINSGAIQYGLPPRFVVIAEVTSVNMLSPKSARHAFQSSSTRIFPWGQEHSESIACVSSEFRYPS
jgi:hypothetical protein